jgi:hypothetical protein
MANDPLAVAAQPNTPNEDEYQTFLSTLSETARGRAFLAEHARRSRGEDNATLLSSVQRLEGLVRSQTEAPPPESVGPNPFDDVRDLLETIRDKQDAFDPGALTAQIGMLAGMIEDVHRRIDTLAVPTPVALPVEDITAPEQEADAPADDLVAAEEPPAVEAEFVAEADIATESVPETPADEDAAAGVEMATPEAETGVALEAEAAAAPDAETAIEPAFDAAPETETPAAEVAPEPADIVAEAEQAEEAGPAIPEVAWDAGEAATEEAAPAPPAGLAISALVETLMVAEPDEPPPQARIIKAGTIPPPMPFAGEDFSGGRRARVMPPEVDPLADIKALSDEERIALFT